MDPTTDLAAALQSARTHQCRLAIARRLVDAREADGLFVGLVQGKLTADVREAMARALVAELQLSGVPGRVPNDQ